MAGPSPYNRKLKARNDRRKARSRGGRTASEAGLGKSMAASGKPVSRTNQRVPSPAQTRSPAAVRVKRNPLATPEVEGAVQRLRQKFSTSMKVNERRGEVRERETDLRDAAAATTVPDEVAGRQMSRTEAMGKQEIAREQTKLNPDNKTVKKFAGRKVEGKLPADAVVRAARDKTLRPAKGNRVATPEVRRVKKQAKRVRKKIAKVERGATIGGMPSGVPKEYAKWIRKYSPRIDKQARETYGLSGNEFMAKMLKGESGFNMDTVGPDTPYGNARGAAQFIPGTRQAFVDKFGIDPWRSKKQAVQAMALHLDGKSYSKTFGIQGYNPGINDSYYLNQDVGETQKANPNAKQRLKQLRGRAKQIDKRAKELGVEGVTRPKPEIAEPKQATGDWAGSQKIIQRILGAGPDLASDKENRGTGSYHDTGNEIAYAQDIPIDGALEQGEPVYDQKLLDKITRRIRKMGGQVPDLTMGMGYTKGSLRGYELEIIPDSRTNSHGTGPHLHIGARWTGENLPPGTQAGGPGGSDGGGGGGGGGTTVTSIGPSGTQTVQYEGNKKNLREILYEIGFDVRPDGIRRVGERDENRGQRTPSRETLKRRYGIK